MGKDEILSDLSHIRSLMEKSTRFISLSGYSGVLIGLYAVAASVYLMMNFGVGITAGNPGISSVITEISIVAIALLMVSVATGLFMARHKSQKLNQSISSPTGKALLQAIGIPLICGGFFAIALALHEIYFFVIPVFLIFYGLSLVSGSLFAFRELKFLGILEVLLGLIALFFPEYSVIFFATGFGVLHIIYGFIIKQKYGA